MKTTLNLIPPAEQPKAVTERFIEMVNELFPNVPRSSEEEMKFRKLMDMYGLVVGLENELQRNKGIRYSAASDIAIMELDQKYVQALPVIGKDLMGSQELYDILKARVAKANGYESETELEVRKKYQTK